MALLCPLSVNVSWQPWGNRKVATAQSLAAAQLTAPITLVTPLAVRIRLTASRTSTTLLGGTRSRSSMNTTNLGEPGSGGGALKHGSKVPLQKQHRQPLAMKTHPFPASFNSCHAPDSINALLVACSCVCSCLMSLITCKQHSNSQGLVLQASNDLSCCWASV